jgi:hypothetical protein
MSAADLLWRRERAFCVDCDFDVIGGGHYCMLRDRVWRELGMSDYSGVLCLCCIEDRLGRPLGYNDFALSRSNADRVFWPRGRLMLPKVWDAWAAGIGRRA